MTDRPEATMPTNRPLDLQQQTIRDDLLGLTLQLVVLPDSPEPNRIRLIGHQMGREHRFDAAGHWTGSATDFAGN